MKRFKRHNKTIINQMNVVPYIDVMLVLLVIFMITAPMFVPGVINLPSVGKASHVVNQPIQINIDKNGAYSLTQNNHTINLDNPDAVVRMVNNFKDPNLSIVISADKDIKYNTVITLIDKLYSNGIKKVALVVKQRNQ